MVNYQINFLEQTKSNLIAQQQAFIDGELGEIQNDYVVNPELPSQNTQAINDIYINFLEEDSNEDVIIQNYSLLLGIAHQCPAAGGQSVYRARAMLSFINDSLEYNDAIVCLQSGIYKEGVLKTNNSPTIKIIPNPANDKIEIILDTQMEGVCQLNILNVLGQSLIDQELNCEISNHFIDVSILSGGIYIIKVMNGFNELTSVKLIISR